MGFDQVFHDRQAEPGAALLARPGGVRAVEPLEDPRQMLAGNPGARVADLEADAGADPGGADGDAAAAARVPRGVLEHVLQDLPDRFGVGPRLAGARLERHVELERLVDAGLDRAPHLAGQRLELDGPRYRPPPTRFDAGEVEQVVDQPLHALGVGQHGGQEPGADIGRRIVLQQGFGVAAHHGERRLELVRDVGDEIAPDGLEPLERGHFVGHEHRAAAGERPARQQDHPSRYVDFQRVDGLAAEHALDGVARDALVEQLAGVRRWVALGQPQQRAGGRVQARHGTPRVARHDALDHGGDQRGRFRAFPFEVGEAARQALVHRAQGAGQVAHFVPAAQVHGRVLPAGDGLRRVAQPYQRPRHVDREPVRQEAGGEQRDQRAGEDRALCAVHQRIHLRDRRGDPHRAAREPHGDLELVAPGGRAAAQVGAAAAGERLANLGARGVVFQRGELVPREVGVGQHRAVPVHHGQAAAGRGAERADQRIERGPAAGCGQRGEVPRLALEAGDRLVHEAPAQQHVGRRREHGAGDHHDGEVGSEQPPGQAHRARSRSAARIR